MRHLSSRQITVYVSKASGTRTLVDYVGQVLYYTFDTSRYNSFKHNCKLAINLVRHLDCSKRIKEVDRSLMSCSIAHIRNVESI